MYGPGTLSQPYCFHVHVRCSAAVECQPQSQPHMLHEELDGLFVTSVCLMHQCLPNAPTEGLHSKHAVHCAW